MTWLAGQATYGWFYRLSLHPRLPLKVFFAMSVVFFCLQTGLYLDLPFLSPGNTDLSAFNMENYAAPNLTPLVLTVMLLATVGHLGIGLAMYETMRIGDCRRCMNEAHNCECGALKDPLPPGSLAHLASAIEARWVPLSQRSKNELTSNHESQ